MKRDLLAHLVCPECRADLTLHVDLEEQDEVRTGELRCDGCAATFPIVDFIPRFVPGASYADAFSWEWRTFARAQLDSATGLRVSDEQFRRAFNFPVEELAGSLVLDAGCGAGRFAEVALNYGAHVVCVDMSEAIDAARANLADRKDAHFLQADIFRLPLRDGTFDLIYSLGVLHHTPDPPNAFAGLPRLLRPGGAISVRVYASYNKATIATSEFYRRFTRRLPKRVLLALCHIAVPLYYVGKVPVLGPLITRILLPVSVAWPTHRWRICNTFDLYSPRYTFFYTHYDVSQWFKRAGLVDVEVVDRLGGVSFIGARPAP